MGHVSYHHVVEPHQKKLFLAFCSDSATDHYKSSLETKPDRGRMLVFVFAGEEKNVTTSDEKFLFNYSLRRFREF